jgi:hypothetical protein
MAESLGRVWIAMTNHRKFIIEADTHDQAAAKFQEKMGYYPKDWQLELMERSDDPLPPEVDLNQ